MMCSMFVAFAVVCFPLSSFSILSRQFRALEGKMRRDSCVFLSADQTFLVRSSFRSVSLDSSDSGLTRVEFIVLANSMNIFYAS